MRCKTFLRLVRTSMEPAASLTFSLGISHCPDTILHSRNPNQAAFPFSDCSKIFILDHILVLNLIFLVLDRSKLDRLAV